MMKNIRECRDLRTSQKRLVLLLECGHLVSIPEHFNPSYQDELQRLVNGAITKWDCGICLEEATGQERDGRPTCYYAHCLSLYGTKQEERDLATIQALGFQPVNPNDPVIEARCTALREDYAASPTGQYTDGSAAVMGEIFRPLATGCTILAFRSLPDGKIPAGVYKEIQWAREANVPVIELPSGLARRQLPLAATREYLREVGQR